MVASKLVVAYLISLQLGSAQAWFLDWFFDFGYNANADCFTATGSLFRAQLRDIETNSDRDTYTLCANNKITVGAASFNLDSYWWDFPLIAVRPNITIKCGEDGSRGNNCILKSAGAIELAAFRARADQFGITEGIDISGVTIQGITFTGILQERVVVSVSAPGFGVTFNDCYFVDLQARHIVSLARRYTEPEDYPVASGSVTVKNSYFKNVAFEGTFFFSSWRNQLTVEDCIFDDITYASVQNNFIFEGIYFVCRSFDQCTFQDSCLSDISWGQALFLEVERNATFLGENCTIAGRCEDTTFNFANNFGSNYLNTVEVDENFSCTDGYASAYQKPETIEKESCQALPGFDAASCPSNADATAVNLCPNPNWLQILLPFLFPC